MSKILTTQLNGLFQRIVQSEEEAIEETARLLAQAAIGQGTIYFACFDELQAVELNALFGAEPFSKLAKWTPDTLITDVDRVCIFTRNSDHQDAISLAKTLYDEFIPFAVIASEPAGESNQLSELAYTYISMKIRGGILPHPTKLGERIVVPHLMAALFIYEAIKMSYDEMISDDDELE
ncbi:hypothetical protein JOD29_002272 [Lysinibacillus composti]|uniref:DUF2529 family protein n=1 Tax=Lysinibacillus composti TaxID=720633 RepID=A0A3N9UST3_9BACI|nr:DUF2529 family protein [Lysinibacillus composti]MBM7609006.1 hypothetical protein [Lysinibacillus composti]RQW75572.1 DUF2529 family protein [Lysinibacillus composti]